MTTAATTAAGMPDLEAANERIERVRKGDFVVRVRGADGESLPGVALALRQTRSHFLFGTCLNPRYVREQSEDGHRYREYVARHFNAGVAENAMKWPAIEPDPRRLTFDDADTLMAFAADTGLAMRGHCLLWEHPRYMQEWVKALPDDALIPAMEQHLADLVPRYAGRIVGWDVLNEMLDHRTYADRVGDDVRPRMFARAHALDPAAPLFVNEYGTVDDDAKIERYRDLVRRLQAGGAPVGGIGVQVHEAARFAGRALPVAEGVRFTEADSPGGRSPIAAADFMRRMDALAAFGLPLHFTEVGATTTDDAGRAEALEAFCTLAFSHPAAECIMLWGFWARSHWRGRDSALVDEGWNVLPAGEIVSELLLHRWRTTASPATDADGTATFRGFYGTYAATLADGRRGTVSFAPGATEATITVQ